MIRINRLSAAAFDRVLAPYSGFHAQKQWIANWLSLQNSNLLKAKIISSFTKQDQIEDSLKTYKTGIDATKEMHDELIANNNPNTPEIMEKWQQIDKAWKELENAVSDRRQKVRI